MTPLTDYPDVLTLDDLARVLRVGRRTLERLRRASLLPIAPLPGVGARVLFARVAVERYLSDPRPAWRVVRRAS